ncbi:MAG: DedA family protein [Gordonia amarae]
MSGIADWLEGLVADVPSWAVYLIACAIVYVETATLVMGFILPSAGVVLAAGVAAAVGPTNIGWLVVALCVAAFAGDLTGYWIGRVSGPRIMSSKAGRRFGGERWVRAQNRVNDSGMIAVATGRWLGFVRTLMPPVAGIVRMRVANFVIADLVGVVTWGTTILLVGYFAGAKLGATLMLSIGALIIVGLVVWWVVKRFRQPAAALADAVGEPPQETPVSH